MGILDAINLRLMPPDARRALLEMRIAASGSLAPGRINKPTWSKNSPINYMDEGYVKLALMFRCVGITSTSMAKAILKVRQDQSDGSGIDLPNHRMQAILRQPNPEMRQNRWLATIGMMASVAGFCVVEKERNNDRRFNPRGDVIAMWPLEPHRCFPVLRNHAPADWEYRVPGIREPFLMEAEDVIVYTYQDRPDLMPYGIGPVEACFREVGLSNIMTDFLKAFFDSGAMPQHGLVLADGVKMDKEKSAHIKDLWRRRHGGLMKSIEPALLEGIKDVKRLSFDMQELAYQGLRDISDTSICQAFGVSPLLVDALAGIAKSTFSNKADARKGFYDETISGLWDRLDDVLTLGLLSEFEPAGSPVSLEFDTSRIKALQEDRNTKATWVIQGFQASGLSQHMMLTELGIPIPKTPDYYVRGIAQEAIPFEDPLGLAQAEADAEAAQLAAESAKALAANVVAPDDADVEDDNIRGLLGPRRILELTGGSGPDEWRAAIGESNRKLISKIANKSTPWIRAFFKAQGARLLKAATREAGIDHETRDVAEIDWSGEEEQLEKTLRRLYALSGETAFAAVTEQLEIEIALSFDLANPNTLNVQELLAAEVKEITEESRKQIQETVTKGLNEGKSIADIATDLEAKLDGWTRARAETVARTESMKSFGYASTAGYRESGVVDRLKLFDNESHTDKYGAADGWSCSERNGQIVALDKAEFHIDSEHPNGSLSVAPVLTGEAA